ncbi:MAG: HNH endonuclease signature motif containing protein [Coprothermobacterota bacterium]|nr:HNH endonuclease signature motif containing protein [Coprothermobacterota bacterium]
MSPEERFFSKVNVGDPDSCWEWQGKTIKDGYGAFHFRGKRVIASRFAWTLFYGEIPPGMYVLHKCDNPACVNPRHLFLGTQKENMQDAVLKLRKSGPHNGKTKLSWPQVDTIRLLLERGWSTYRLAKLFEVDHKTIWQIREGKTWREPAEVMLHPEREKGLLEAEKKGMMAESPWEPEEKEVMPERIGKPEEDGSGEAVPFGLFKLEGGAELKAPLKNAKAFFKGPVKKEECEMRSKGMWFITERVKTPALTLEFPVGFFCSREAALAFIKGKEKTYRMRFIQSDLGEEVPSGNLKEENCEVQEASSGSLGEAEENFQRNLEERAPEKTQGIFSGCKKEEF